MYCHVFMNHSAKGYKLTYVYVDRQTDRHTDGRGNIHFASVMPHVKCNKTGVMK